MMVVLGVLLGLSTLLFVGPVLFYLVKSSMEGGFLAGFFVALGIIVGDIICVILAVYGLNTFLESPENQKWIAALGGVILLLLGLKYIFKPGTISESKKSLASHNLLVYFVNGFLINFINPFVFAVWFGFYALIKSKLLDKQNVIITMIIILVVIFITDLLKAHFALKIKQHFTIKNLKNFYLIIGVLMIVFAARLFSLLIFN